MTDRQTYNQKIIADFRTTRDASGIPLNGRPLLLLTTTGAKSGLWRTTPLMFFRDGERYIVFASNNGAATHPDWYRNLVAHPDVTVEVGAETFEGRATVAEGAERERLWQQAIAVSPNFADHQANIARQIPAIVLSRRSG